MRFVQPGWIFHLAAETLSCETPDGRGHVVGSDEPGTRLSPPSILQMYSSASVGPRKNVRRPLRIPGLIVEEALCKSVVGIFATRSAAELAVQGLMATPVRRSPSRY